MFWQAKSQMCRLRLAKKISFETMFPNSQPASPTTTETNLSAHKLCFLISRESSPYLRDAQYHEANRATSTRRSDYAESTFILFKKAAHRNSSVQTKRNRQTKQRKHGKRSVLRENELQFEELLAWRS